VGYLIVDHDDMPELLKAGVLYSPKPYKKNPYVIGFLWVTNYVILWTEIRPPPPPNL
jgi:hypothetical protein